MAHLHGKEGAVKYGGSPTEYDGINSWSLDYQAEAVETTDFQDSGVKTFIAGVTGWSGSFEGLKDGAPPVASVFNQVVVLELWESDTLNQKWTGNAIITGISVTTDVKGAVSYSYTFQGTGALTAASA